MKLNLNSSKSPAFDPANPEPEFDPSKDSKTAALSQDTYKRDA